MKLPEYDNRPKPGEPLFRTEDGSGPWEDFVFPLLAIGLPILLVLCFGYAIVSCFSLLKALLL